MIDKQIDSVSAASRPASITISGIRRKVADEDYVTKVVVTFTSARRCSTSSFHAKQDDITEGLPGDGSSEKYRITTGPGCDR